MALVKRVLMMLWTTILLVAWLVCPASFVLTHAARPALWGAALIAGALLAFAAFWYRGRWRVSARWPRFPFEVLAPFSILGAVVGTEVLLWAAGGALFR